MTTENMQQTDIKKLLLREILSLEQKINGVDPEENGAAHRQYEHVQDKLREMVQQALNWDMHKDMGEVHVGISMNVGMYIGGLAQRYKLKKEGDPDGQESAL